MILNNCGIESLTIKNLKKELERGNRDCITKFWEEIKSNGNPLIEEIDGEKEYSLVTYFYKGDEKTENTVLLQANDFKNHIDNRMEKLLDINLWYKTYKIMNGIKFPYDFSVNDLLDDNLEKRFDNLIHDEFSKNKVIFKGDEGDEDFIRSIVIMPNYGEDFWVKKRKVSSSGKLVKHKFHSEKLNNDRRVWIYTPKGYSESDKPYGFLLLTDGEVYINALSTTTVLDNLIEDKKIPPIITIFVDTKDNRFEELNCNESFGEFLVEEIIPWVSSKYNISNKADEGIIGGHSLGGLTASYVGLNHSKVFGNVLSQSGSYWYKPEGFEKNNWMSEEFKNINKLPLKFYLNVGVLELKEDMIDTNIELRDTLKNKGYEVYYEQFKSGHDYLSWGETLANGLISLIGK